MQMQNPQSDPNQTRNLVLAIALSLAFLFAYQALVLEPQARERRAALAAEQAEQQRIAAAAPPEAATAAAPELIDDVDAALSAPPPPPRGADAASASASASAPRAEAAGRIPFDSGRVRGSINLSGARIDDLTLTNHFMTVEREQPVRLMRPALAPNGFEAAFGWQGYTPLDARWEQIGGRELSPGNPVVLRTQTGDVTVTRTVSLDESYMFTFEDEVRNAGRTPLTLVPVGLLRRYGTYEDFLNETDPGSANASGLVFQGAIRMLGTSRSKRNYKNLEKGRTLEGEDSTARGGWLAFTDKYWMASLIPRQDQPFEANVRVREAQGPGGQDIYEAITRSEPIVLEAGRTLTYESRVFAGTKRLSVLRGYEEAGLPRFTDSIDWGFLYFLTKPFFQVLLWLNNLLGGFGWAILAFTVLVKAVLFPLYNRSYRSMAKLKKLSGPMKEITEKFKDDPAERQKQMMALYSKEGANPIAGCLPILATIPVFYALYKVLFVTIEMRHEPFWYLADLSAPDPTAIGNLFGLLPFVAGADLKAVPILGLIIGVGFLPVLYGVSMAGLQALSPPPPDPTQRTIMMLLPIVFTFVFGGFAAGLVLYWVWNNILSLIQQYIIMRRSGVLTQLDKLLLRLRGKPVPAE